ncbi:ATF/CREB family transcription factor [Entomortierella parvispora]|uniref:ATF/CREB family transcription factor n=1 Tax=Entomortierella parvispora TaxID=205924 RepID=A0A9P3HH29_9FUNG|nr:ATF/CREB family transcription factor [Entomortierella parvispora]
MTTVGTLSTDLGPDDNKLERASNNAGGFLQVTTKLDMEPNPFEQSFSGLSPEQQQAATAAAVAAAAAAGGNINATSTAAAVAAAAGVNSETSNKPVLPPIEAMSGRLAVSSGGDQYNGWDAPSLRMGPLSPSMLEGPQNPITVVSSGAAVSSAIFTSGADGLAPQQQHHAPLPVTVDNGFPFLTNAPTHGPHIVGGATIQTTESYQPQMYSQISQMRQQPQGVSRPMGSVQQQHPQYAQHPNGQLQERYMAPAANDHHGDYSNLHLLSQATQREMWIKRESMDAGHLQQQQQQQQQQRLGHPQNGMLGMAGGPQQQQQHLQQQQKQQQPSKESVDSGLARHTRMQSEDNQSEDSDRSRQSSEGATSSNGKKRPASEDKMDDEEKRRNFLERNRQAALKCRQRKKQWLSNLQAKVEYLSTDNDHLQAQTASLRDEIIHLKALLLAHKDCPVAQANGVYSENIRPQSGTVPPPPHLSSAVAGTSQTQQNNQRNTMNGHRPPPQMQTGGGGLVVGGHPNIHGQVQASVRY